MSGPQTYRKALLRCATASLDDDNPVSVMRAWAVKTNTQHLIDQSPQHRINWMAGPQSGAGYAHRVSSVSTGDRTVYYTFPFVHTVLDELHPCGLDVRICGRVSDAMYTVNMTARVVPNVIAPTWDFSVPSYIGTQTGSTASTSSTQIINYQWQPDDGVGWRMHWQGVAATHGSRPEMVYICMSRLELKVVVEAASEQYADITGIMVREYC